MENTRIYGPAACVGYLIPIGGKTLKRIIILLAMLVSLVTLSAILVGCGGSNNTGTTTGGANNENTAVDGTTNGGRMFTLTELAQFDGKDGNPAYVAVDGVVYDVSASSSWPQGDHTPCNLDAMAGKDLSEVIKKAPANMRSLLQNMPVVGTLQQ
jgi:predicted heme/steroid binding protein